MKVAVVLVASIALCLVAGTSGTEVEGIPRKLAQIGVAQVEVAHNYGSKSNRKLLDALVTQQAVERIFALYVGPNVGPVFSTGY